MDVLESRVPRPNQPDHGLYIWPQNLYIDEHLKHFKKAQKSLPLGAVARGVIDYEAAETFIESGLHEAVEGLPVIPGEHIRTALGVFERAEYYDNRRALLATGVQGLATTLRLKRHFSSKQINTARDIAQEILSITPIMEWINAAGYIATRGQDGNLAIRASLYNQENDKLDYELYRESDQRRWAERCKFIRDNEITHVAGRYRDYTDSASYPLPLLMPPPGNSELHIVEELGWLIDGVFEPATPQNL